MELTDLCGRLDEELRVADYADLDASANGLQVGPDAASVEHVAFAVDAAVETIEAAVDVGADLLVVHHGIVWGGLDRLTGEAYRRVAPLLDHDLALYVAHLPLDGHPELGNAAGVADLLDLADRSPFGALGPETVGIRGRRREPLAVDDLAATLDDALETGGRDVQVLPFGPDAVESVAVLTGAGAEWIEEAADAGVDAFVTGEGKGRLYHQARELEVNALLAGHYATETFGVRRLESLAAEWGLDTTYVDRPTGL